MSDENIKKHLRAALAEAIDVEKAKVQEMLDDTEKRVADGVTMMAPLIKLIEALRDEIGEVEGLMIRPSIHGHIASVTVRDSASSHRLSISTDLNNEKYAIEETISFSFAPERSETTHKYDTADQAMQHIVKVVGKHIGSAEAHQERKDG
ncbi:MAG: hypothetical protein IIA07_07190 [Proteobacteria bacterium]|nr:hypothetical protein [Pseudomonadota bacterium]